MHVYVSVHVWVQTYYCLHVEVCSHLSPCLSWEFFCGPLLCTLSSLAFEILKLLLCFLSCHGHAVISGVHRHIRLCIGSLSSRWRVKHFIYWAISLFWKDSFRFFCGLQSVSLSLLLSLCTICLLPDHSPHFSAAVNLFTLLTYVGYIANIVRKSRNLILLPSQHLLMSGTGAILPHPIFNSRDLGAITSFWGSSGKPYIVFSLCWAPGI